MDGNLLLEARVEAIKTRKSRYRMLQSEAFKLIGYHLAKARLNSRSFDLKSFMVYLGVHDIRPAKFTSSQKASLKSSSEGFVIEVSERLGEFGRKFAS
ncbi:MAG: hypothetical protein AB1589_42690, partial [Cyanobacteriota bacterium]